MWVVIYVLIVAGSFIMMEGVAWLTHKYIMHGLLWYLHKDHHQKKPHFFEKNDAFFLIFATPSILLFLFGLKGGINWMFFMGLGIFLYGMAYFIVHDVIIHQRFKWFTRSDNLYIKSVRWAHKMHHKHLNKQEGESFGMLFISRKYWEKIIRERQYQ